MRICFVSRRYFPAVSGMSIYAVNLLRELVADGHDVTMISQYYDGEHATVYGGGCPASRSSGSQRWASRTAATSSATSTR